MDQQQQQDNNNTISDSDLPHTNNTSHKHRTHSHKKHKVKISKQDNNRDANNSYIIDAEEENYELDKTTIKDETKCNILRTKEIRDDSFDDEYFIIDEDKLSELLEPDPLVRNNRLIALGGVTDIGHDLGPILGYAEEPILPLHEACMPLSDILVDIPFYVQLALDETPEVPLDDLTVDESAAIRLYTIEWKAPHRSLYSMLNYTLKTKPRVELRPYFKYLKLFLTAIVKLPCVPPTTVWRGVRKDLSAEFPHGALVTWWSFSSCTTELTVLENKMYLGDTDERTLFSVEAMNGRTIRDHSHFVTEDEILLLPGTHMEVQSQFSPAPDLHIVHLKQVKPTETLLEPPFENAQIYPPEKKAKPWYKKPRTLLELGIVVVLCIVGIIVGAVVGSRRPPPPPLCYTREPTLKANYIWSFDCSDAREDLTGLYNGTLMNMITFISPDFSGQGKAIQLTRDQKDYVVLPRSLNLTLNTSFALSTWIFLTGYRPKPILTDCSNLTSLCISFIIKDVNVTALIYKLDDEHTVQSVDFVIQDYLCQPCWVYITFTYDHRNGSLIFYFNGIATQTRYLNITYTKNVAKNKASIAYIGIDPRNTTQYYNGPLDQLSVAYYAKNASEILDEATLLCQYNFETDDIASDSGPNNIDARTQNVYLLKKHDAESLLFNASDSYFQSSGFALIESYTYEFSISFWLRLILQQPDKENSAIAVLQLSTLISGLSSDLYTCVISLHVNPINGTIGFFFPKLYRIYSISNASMQNNTWTHIGIAYDSPENYFFYINGKLAEAIGDRRFSTLISSNSRLSVTIGGAYLDDSITNKPDNYDQMKCFARIPVFNYTQMYGAIDNFIFFARMLQPSEFASLAASKPQ